MKKNKTIVISAIICIPVLVLVVSLVTIICKIYTKNNATGAYISAATGTDYVSLFLGLDLGDQEKIDYYHDFYKDVTTNDSLGDDVDTYDTGYSVTITQGKNEQKYSIVVDNSKRYESAEENPTTDYLVCVEENDETSYYTVSEKKVLKLMKQIIKDLDISDTLEPIDDSDIAKWNTSVIEQNTYNGYPKNQIVAVMDSANYAWGMYKSGYFIDLSGNYYTYNLCDRDLWAEAGKAYPDLIHYDCYYRYLYDVLYSEFYLTSDPIGRVDEDEIRIVYCEGLFLPDDMEYDEKEISMDAGQSTIYYMSGYNFIELYSDGDIRITAKNADAKDMVKKLENIDIVEYY